MDIGTFEDTFLKKAFFLGENRLDHALMSLLHLLDAGPRIKTEDHEGITYLIDIKSFEMKINKGTNKSIKQRLIREKSRQEFSYVKFSHTYRLKMDTINGILPLRFKNSRLVFHTLRLAYAIFLTMKMFKVTDVSENERVRKRNWKFQKTKSLLSHLFIHLYCRLRKLNLKEKSLIKCIKNSFCMLVSKALCQDELPEGDSIPLFSDIIHHQIRSSLSDLDYTRFCFSILQSKSLCQEVPEEFILETLIKHRDQLSSPHRGLSPQTLNKLRERGREFGKKVRKYYKPENGFFPTNKATFAFPRDRGGVKGDLVYHDRLKDTPSKEDPDDRMEPLVIGLFGQPGQGKSSRIPEIVSKFSSLFPGLPIEKLTYQRTCHVEHWDGYQNQPIVIFDDLGQSSDGHDIREFQTLVSCCPYILPMAHLDEKGVKFNSPIIICTSNLKYGMPLIDAYGAQNPIIDDASFWRRFHIPLYVESGQLYKLKEEPSWVRKENFIINRLGDTTYPGSNMNTSRYFRRKPEFSSNESQELWTPCNDLSDLISSFKRRKWIHANIRNKWIQTVVDKTQDTSILNPLLSELEEYGFTESVGFRSGTGSIKSLVFPAYPPEGPLPVRVEPILEPLKVRTITAGIGDTFCLKPLQRAMWLALDDYPQFCLTHGTNRLDSAIERIYNLSNEDDVWISGDYSAATDSFSIEGSRALMEGILESIDHEPTKRWAMKELSPHLLIYPQGSGLDPVLQKSGQLMGSLLSFPLLCLLNDCTAQFSGLSPTKYLINGDDILMRAPATIYPKWKGIVHEFGLDLSLGKNYIHPRYGTVNSQLILDGEVVGAGKQTILDRRSQILGECLRDLELAMPESDVDDIHELFKSVNRAKLSKTVRDIDVPVSHGGLAFSWGKKFSFKKKDPRSRRTAHLCYLYDMFNKIKPNKGCISIPYLSIREKKTAEYSEEEMIFNDPVSVKEYHESFVTQVSLSIVSKRCMTHPNLRNLLLGQELEKLPSLTFLHTYQIPCSDVKIRKELQKEIDALFLRNFLQGGQDYSYDVFREEFLRTTMNLSTNSEKTVTHLVSLMDLNVRPDFLNYLNLDFDPTGFDSELFQKNLGKALEPKEFNLPEIEQEEFIDFSKEVVDIQLSKLQEIFQELENLMNFEEF